MLCQFVILQYLNKLSLVCSIVRIGLFISPCQSLSISMTGIDYVSHHHKKLNCLPFVSQTHAVLFTLCYMYQYYHPSHCGSTIGCHAVLLDTPIAFGPQHTDCTENFTNLD